MLDLGGADAVGERPEGAVRRRMAVAADDSRAGQRETLLGADHVNDALPLVELVIVFKAEKFRVFGEVSDLRGAFRVFVRLAAVGGRHIVVDHAQRLFRRAHFPAGEPQSLEGLRARHLMDEVAVDVEQAGAVRLLVDQMVVPDLVVEGPGFRHHPMS